MDWKSSYVPERTETIRSQSGLRGWVCQERQGIILSSSHLRITEEQGNSWDIG